MHLRNYSLKLKVQIGMKFGFHSIYIRKYLVVNFAHIFTTLHILILHPVAVFPFRVDHQVSRDWHPDIPHQIFPIVYYPCYRCVWSVPIQVTAFPRSVWEQENTYIQWEIFCSKWTLKVLTSHGFSMHANTVKFTPTLHCDSLFWHWRDVSTSKVCCTQNQIYYKFT
jgi:hypothetical protein